MITKKIDQTLDGKGLKPSQEHINELYGCFINGVTKSLKETLRVTEYTELRGKNSNDKKLEEWMITRDKIKKYSI
jgi:hypothetical protein